MVVCATSLLFVIFITFGISYEVSQALFQPLKSLLSKLRNMQYQNTDIDVGTTDEKNEEN